MARKATRELAKQLLTAKQFAAWCRMSPKLSASELRAGKRPGGAAKRPGKRKAPAKRSASSADVFLASQWARHGGGLPDDWEAGIRSNPRGRRKARRNPAAGRRRNSRGQFVRGYKRNCR